MNVHCEIKPFKVLVPSRFFYNMEIEWVGDEPLHECDVFAISSYQGHQITFSVRIRENGGLFHYLPIHALHSKPDIFKIANKLQEHTLCYHNCPDWNISVNSYEFLQGDVTVFIRSEIHPGKYVLTIDWYKANQNMHLISLRNGQFCLVPSHKVLFRSKKSSLPDYKKLYAEWR